MTPQVTSPRHPFEELFAKLTGAMRIVHELGPVTNGVPGQPGRMVWNIRTAEPVNRGYRRQGQNFCGFLAVGHEVEIYGGSPLEVVQNIAALEGWLDILVGPEQGSAAAGDGYKIGKSTPIETGDGTTTGAGCKLPVTLYVPTYQMVLGSAVVAGHVNVSTTVLAPDGSVPAGDPLNPLQASA